MFEVEQMRTHKHALIRPPSPPLVEEKISICQALLQLSPNQKTKDKRFRAWSDVQDKEEHNSWSFQYNDHWLICGLCSVSDHEIIFRYINISVSNTPSLISQWRSVFRARSNNNTDWDGFPLTFVDLLNYYGVYLFDRFIVLFPMSSILLYCYFISDDRAFCRRTRFFDFLSCNCTTLEWTNHDNDDIIRTRSF